MLIQPKPGARLGESDPLCKVKPTAELIEGHPHEHYKTEGGKWFEERREYPIEQSHIDFVRKRGDCQQE